VALVVVLASIPASAEPPHELQIVAGNDQQAARGTAVNHGARFAPLSVKATISGNPTARLPVTFSCAASSGVRCMILNQDIDTRTVSTGADGIATLADQAGTSSIFTRGDTGTLTVTASAPGYSSVQLRLTVVDPGRFRIVFGRTQYVVAGAGQQGATFLPLYLQAIPSSGNANSGLPVTFSCAASAGLSCELGGQAGPWILNTDVGGVLLLSDASNTKGISSRGGTGTLLVTMSAPVYLPAISRLTIVDSGQLVIANGNNQRRVRVPPGSSGLGETFAPLFVTATTASGMPVTGVPVTFSCAAPAGLTCSLANKQQASVTVVTDDEGAAILADWSGYVGIVTWGGTGTLTVTASAPGFGSVTFQETVVAP
jgi:hypothetical protein